VRSLLLVAQDEAVPVAVDERERVRRVWCLALRRERLTLLDKLSGASITAEPIPPAAVCVFPGCGRETKLGGLCGTHTKQRLRNGPDGLFPIGTRRGFTGKKPRVGGCAQGHNDWRTGRNGVRRCHVCELGRQARRRAAKQGPSVGPAEIPVSEVNTPKARRCARTSPGSRGTSAITQRAAGTSGDGRTA